MKLIKRFSAHQTGRKIASLFQDNSHYYCDKDGAIKCFPGWSVPETMCQVAVCEGPNGEACINGNCTKPYVCQCDIGWYGNEV